MQKKADINLLWLAEHMVCFPITLCFFLSLVILVNESLKFHLSDLSFDCRERRRN